MNRAVRAALNLTDYDAALHERGMKEAVWTEQTVTSSATRASATVLAVVALVVLLFVSLG